jgi:hypothetical protein
MLLFGAMVWTLHHVRPACPDLAPAQKRTCLELLLCFIVVTAPTKVMMHPHEYLNHLTCIEELRDIVQKSACCIFAARLPAFGGSISTAERITDMHPRERPQSNISTFDVPNFQQVAMAPPGLGLGADELDAYVANLLQNCLVHGQWYQDSGSPCGCGHF